MAKEAVYNLYGRLMSLISPVYNCIYNSLSVYLYGTLMSNKSYIYYNCMYNNLSVYLLADLNQLANLYIKQLRTT